MPGSHSANRMLDFAPDNIKWKIFVGFSATLLKASQTNSRMLISCFGLETHWWSEYLNSFSCSGLSASVQELNFSHCNSPETISTLWLWSIVWKHFFPSVLL